MDYFNQFFYKKNNYFSLIIESTEKVAYAYLLEGENIISDVWLCNIEPAPEQVKWKEQTPPFLNPKYYLSDKSTFIINDFDKQLSINWKDSDEDDLQEVRVLIDNELLAVLKKGCKPGWSKLVNKNGPLAKVLN